MDGSIRAGTQVEPAPFQIRTTGLSSSGTELDEDKEEESGGGDDRRRGTRRRKRREESFFPLTLLLASRALHASSPSGQPGGRAGHRRPSSPSPFWSRWRSKQEGCGGARNDVVRRCLTDPLAVTFEERGRGKARRATAAR